RETTAMEAMLQRKTVYVDGQSLELWSPPTADFSCRPQDLRSYVTSERWDLVFNALCYLAGAVEEGLA
ncbi:MAG: hypothetical protein ACREEP_20670, partial [Dongiaceae bacterium]